ncbi:MAG: hypothetical protein JWO85_2127 [Candidatus Eremiobacteraeota bacterium]|nr:hypothetical protein [Candidatus Eremiobacteraeota bacterium]
MADFQVGDRVRVEYDGMLFDNAIYIGLADNNRDAQFECDGDRLEAPFGALTVVARAHYAPPGVPMIELTPELCSVLRACLTLSHVAKAIAAAGKSAHWLTDKSEEMIESLLPPGELWRKRV